MDGRRYAVRGRSSSDILLQIRLVHAVFASVSSDPIRRGGPRLAYFVDSSL